ncbi:DinB family protein [Sphingoaurantiacus capsulatus]|uniref:DinB family protein n=1 Tax=Sphingoaurantiacus capsulatus TaxID=1771310 RepID=A0ABV7XE66_9SPHN
MQATIDALARFPDELERFFLAIPPSRRDWTPPSWDGVPSEPYTAIGQLCHVRDIETDGYHFRFRRLLDEEQPFLGGVDGDALVVERRYAESDPAEVIAAIRAARAETVDLLSGLDASQLARTGEFEDYGRVTLRAMVHYLASHDQQHLSGLQWLAGKIASEEAR